MKKSKVKIGAGLKEIITLCFLTKLPLLLDGETGIGKTEIIVEVARELGIECIVCDLTIMEPVDLIGLPVKEGSTVKYLPPDFLPKKGNGIHFLDELNRAAQQMLNGCLQLLSGRRLNQYQLPDGWLVIAAVNPDDNDAYQTNKLDDAMLARFVLVEVEPCVKSWIQWAEKNDVHEAVIAFVKETPKIFNSRKSNPRAWKKISAFLKYHQRGNYNIDTLQAVVEGCVGVELAVAFIATLRRPESCKVPDPALIVDDYAKARKLVCTFSKNGNTPALESLCQQMFRFLQDPKIEAKIRNCPKEMANLLQFRSDLMAEFQSKLDDHAPWIVKGGQTA